MISPPCKETVIADVDSCKLEQLLQVFFENSIKIINVMLRTLPTYTFLASALVCFAR